MQSLQFAPDSTDSIRIVHIQAKIEQEVISLRSVRNLGKIDKFIEMKFGNDFTWWKCWKLSINMSVYCRKCDWEMMKMRMKFAGGFQYWGNVSGEWLETEWNLQGIFDCVWNVRQCGRSCLGRRGNLYVAFLLSLVTHGKVAYTGGSYLWSRVQWIYASVGFRGWELVLISPEGATPNFWWHEYRFSAFWLRSKCSICSYQLNIWWGQRY